MASREPSPAPSSDGDTIDDQGEDRKPRLADLDREGSAAEPSTLAETPTSAKSTKRGKGHGVKKPRVKKGSHVWIHEGPLDGTEDEDAEAKTVGTSVGTRRQANGTVGSVYSGSKIRHIKKPDGTPLWRKEIQYDFLRRVIEDTTPVFTRLSDGKGGCNFADIYIDCMARSSKTSKILKDRLSVDRHAAQNMAMICLLVNVGRMNTTLNFFPEMRAQLRTYHSIPALQAYKSQRDYKSLQDAPRLKSILKGASEDEDQPRNLWTIQQATVPRTNPVNLIFVISQFAPKIAEKHFTDKIDFFDLAIRGSISSASRARAFLWLMWWYLEATPNQASALANPFGAGQFTESQDPTNEKDLPLLVPSLVQITEEEGDAENVDTEEEKIFADKMTRERKRIMSEVADEPVLRMADPELPRGVKRLKKGARDFADEDALTSDADSRASPAAMSRSPAPGAEMVGVMSGHISGSVLGGQADSLEDDWEPVDPHPGRGRYKRVKGKNTPTRGKKGPSDGPRGGTGRARSSMLGPGDRGTPDTVKETRRTTGGSIYVPGWVPPNPWLSVGPPGSVPDALLRGSRTWTPLAANDPAPAKARGRTGYQRELEERKNRRVEWLLRRKRRDALQEARARRERAPWLLKTARRIGNLDTTYDSEDEDGLGAGWGMGGVIGRRWVGEEAIDEDGNPVTAPPGYEGDDFGEEAQTWLKVFMRAKRRLEVWSGDRDQDVYHARQERVTSIGGEGLVDLVDENGLANGTVLKAPTGTNGQGRRRGGRKRKNDLNDEITQDLLAERSDEEMADAEGDADADVDDGEGDADADADGDADGDVDAREYGEGDADEVNCANAAESDVEMT